jgi:tripartite-type tricarboxylate transporter receptor subunit TctC
MRKYAFLTAFALLSVIASPFDAQPVLAEVYSAKPVKIVVPYPAGGPNDTIARLIAQKLSERLGGQFYVENLPGAGGTIGTDAAARAPADGSTILIANQDFVVQPIIKAKVPYDPFNSFVPVSQIVSAPEMIVVHPSLPVTTVDELIALLRANPGKYSYASPGYGTSPHLACEWLFRLTYNLDVTHVPFQGAAPAVMSALSGQTPIFHNTLPAVAQHIKDGKLRALAVASRVRSAMFPEVPTLAEAGVPGHEVAFWIGALVPAGTPVNLVQQLQREIAAIAALPDIRDRLAALGFDLVGGPPQDFAALIKAESDKWRNVVTEAHLKID